MASAAETHSFFRVLYAKWFYLHSKGFKNNGENVTCALDELRSLPEALPLCQKQIQRFFELVLDIDKAGRISDSEFYSSYIAALGEKLRRARQGMFPCQALRSFSFLLFQSTGIPDPHSMAKSTNSVGVPIFSLCIFTTSLACGMVKASTYAR